MRILIVNPIIYTSETAKIKKSNTIKDTMIYDLCLAFQSLGHTVHLAACIDYKPENEETYPFDVLWLNAKLKNICKVNALPYCPDVKKIIKNNDYDLIITSEVFSLNSLMLALKSKKNLIVWHELAKHNNILKKIPSKVWYGVIAKIFFKDVLVVPRSIEAKQFISKYCNNVSNTIIDHGVNLSKFTFCNKKENIFAVCSQLIERKQIDKILIAFSDYINKYDKASKLYIMGEGEEKSKLISLSEKLNINKNVIFTGKLNHDQLINILMKSQAMLVYTKKDNNMVSIVESIAVGTPIITTSVPYNARYIKDYKLGIVDDNWDCDAINKVASNNEYITNCLSYRETLSTLSKVQQFTELKNTINMKK